MFFVAFISAINVFLILTTLFFMHTIALHKRFEVEPVAQAYVLPYSQQYQERKDKYSTDYRTDLQFQTPDRQTVYLHDMSISSAEKTILENGGQFHAII